MGAVSASSWKANVPECSAILGIVIPFGHVNSLAEWELPHRISRLNWRIDRDLFNRSVICHNFQQRGYHHHRLRHSQSQSSEPAKVERREPQLS
jgi:hypothetical protein